MPCPTNKLPGFAERSLCCPVRCFLRVLPVILLLQIFCVHQSEAQVRAVPVPDSSVKYRKFIDGLISREAAELCNKISKDRFLFEKIIGPCIYSGKNNGYEQMLNMFFAELSREVIQEVANIYEKGSNGSYFNKRKIQEVEKYVEAELSRLKKKMPDNPDEGRNVRAKAAAKNPYLSCLISRCNPDSIPNTPPNANAGKDRTITGNTVTLDGSASRDEDKDILTYQWQKLEGNGPPFITDRSSEPTSTAPVISPGKYSFVLTVYDSRNASDRDTVVITVQKPVIRITANAGGRYSIKLPATKARLQGSGSPPSLRLDYSWAVKANQQNVRILSPKTAVTDVEITTAGTYEVILTVSDTEGNNATDEATIIVTAPEQPANNPPEVKAGEDITIFLPENSVVLNGSVKDKDNDLPVTRWTYFPGNQPAIIVTPSSPVTEVTSLAEGVYNFVLSANDKRNGFAADTVVVTVKKKPVEDTIPKKNPRAIAGDNLTITPGTFNLSGSGKDEDGQVVKYQWEQLGGPVRITPDDPLSPTSPLQLKDTGTYVYQLTVTDNDGLQGTDTVLIQVIPGKDKKWLWILVGAILLGSSVSYWYFFIWLRFKRKLILYFMDGREEALAQKLMSNYDKSDGCVVGHASRGNIKEMEKEGLAFRLLTPGLLTINTPGEVREYHYSLKKGEYVLKNVTRKSKGHRFVNLLAGVSSSRQESTFPAYYIITLDSPLLPKYSDTLESAGLPVLYKVPQYSYVVKVNEPQQLERLHNKDEFPFIRLVEPYTAADTGFTVNKEQYAKAAAGENDGRILLDVVLHSRDEMEQVITMFTGKGAIAQGTYNRTLRISIASQLAAPEMLASDPRIQAIYQHLPPVLHNDETRSFIGIDTGEPPAAVFPETGKDEVVAMADSGIDEHHPDLSKRIAGKAAWGRDNDTSDPDGHGTHVAGTIAGDGSESAGKIKGMAPGAKLFVQSLLNKNGELADLEMNSFYQLLQEAYDHDARIINLSWGALQESYYTVEAEMIDQFMYENPEVLVVVAAGNEGVNTPGASSTDASTPGYVGSFASNKNGLTVGAGVSKRDNSDSESVASYSNRGPCDDYRIKPDIVAPGTYILSARSAGVPESKYKAPGSNPAYAFKGGTSMAAPVVSGAAALVREYFRKRKKNQQPSAILVKATLLNGTRQLSGSGAMQGTKMIPNNHQGFGMLNMLTTIPNKQNDFALWYADSFETPDLVFTKKDEERFWLLTLKADSWIRVCMVYRDRAVRSTQADLTLLMALNGTTSKWWGNAGIKSNGEFPDKEEFDRDNNTEIIRLEKANAGQYKIAIKAANIRMDEVGFALVVTTGDTASKLTTATK